MRPDEESIIPEGSLEEEDKREMEYLMNYPRPVGDGAETVQRTEAQPSWEEDEGPDVIVEDEFNKESIPGTANNCCKMRMDITNNTDSNNASANNAEGERRMNDGMNETHGRNVSSEHAGRVPMHGRRTSGRTKYGPGYYARLHEGP